MVTNRTNKLSLQIIPIAVLVLACPATRSHANHNRTSQQATRAKLTYAYAMFRQVRPGQKALEAHRDPRRDPKLSPLVINERLRRVAAAHPDMMALTCIGEVPSPVRSRSGKCTTAQKLPIYELRLTGSPGQKKLEALIVAGVHAGSEPSAVLAACNLIEDTSSLNRLLDRYNLTVITLANPSAAILGTRRTAAGLDLNDGQFIGKGRAPEAKLMIAALKNLHPDLVLDLHGAIDNYYVTYLKSQSKPKTSRLSGKPATVSDAVTEKLCAKIINVVDRAKRQGSNTEEGLCQKPGVMAQREWFSGSLQEWGYDRLGARLSLTLEYSRRDSPRNQTKNMCRMLKAALLNAADMPELSDAARANR